MLTGYTDENVQSAIVAGLRQRSMDIVTAEERNQRQTDDEVLLETATAEQRLMLSNDTDFLRIHAEWLRVGRDHAGIVFWRQDLSIGETITRILQYAHGTSAEDARNILKYL
jgi:hypothetical protein